MSASKGRRVTGAAALAAVLVLSISVSPAMAQDVPAGFEFFQGQDSGGSDIAHLPQLAGNWAALAAACLSRADCVCFNAAGWIKYYLKPKSGWNSFLSNDPCQGLFVKAVAPCNTNPKGIGAVFTCNGTESGQQCQGRCKRGYTAASAPKATCNNGVWGPVSSKCTLTDLCKSIHRGCATCRLRRNPKTGQNDGVCSTCETGFRLRKDIASRTCDCAPGMSANSTGEEMDNWCTPCPRGSFCPGGSADNPDSTAFDCPTGLETKSVGAKSQSQCFTKPGWGRKQTKGSGGSVIATAELCPVATFNVGGNTAGCQKCGAGLTTRAPGAKAASECVAPAGSFVDKGTGKLCPKGTYTDDYNSSPFCSEGSTTTGQGSTSAAQCNLASLGYYLLQPGATNDTAAKCPKDSYNDREATIYSCRPCPSGLMTQDVGTKGVSDCLVAPGYEWKSPDVNVSACPMGWFKEGWNRNPCLSCGINLITAQNASVSRDQCLVPEGFGLISLNPPHAQMCTSSTYGVPVPRPAGASAVCSACRANMFTMDSLLGDNVTEGYQSEDACVVRPGWGIDSSGMVVRCPLGFINPGYNRAPCESCPTAYMGIPAVPSDPDSLTVCVIQAGWQMSRKNGIPEPCDRGTWSAGGTLDNLNSSCVACPAGFTTQRQESVAPGDCNVCEPGRGGQGCTICPHNTFGQGGAMEDQECSPCPAGTVSARGNGQPSECFPQTTTAIADFFPVSSADSSASALTQLAAADTLEACRAACVGNDSCVLFNFNEGAAPADRCQVLTEDASGNQTLAVRAGRGEDLALYQVPGGLQVGLPLSSGSGVDNPLTREQCIKACRATGACEVAAMDAAAVASGAAGRCSMFRSDLDQEWTGELHIQGSRLFQDRLVAV